MQEGRCQECGAMLYRDGDEKVCSRCGLVVPIKDFEAEAKKSFVTDEDSRRDAEFDYVPDKNLGSQIGNGKFDDSFELWLKEKKSNENSKEDMKKRIYYDDIRAYSSSLNLPQSAFRFVMKIYQQLEDRDFFDRKSVMRKNSLSAIVLFSTREIGVMRTVEEIIDVTGGRKDRVLNIYKKIMNELDKYQLPPEPIDFVDKFCSDLNLSQKHRAEVKDLIEKNENWWMNKKAKGVVGGAIYYISQENGKKLTQEHISSCLKIHRQTIKKRFKELKEVEGRS